MDHGEAVRSQAAERYVLGELPAGEREAFEEHFFQCSECAREVRLGAIFLANVRAVLAEQAERADAGLLARILDWRLLKPVALAACLVFGLSTAYLGLVSVPSLKRELAGLRAPQAYPAVFLRPLVRGDEQVVEIPRQSRFVGFWADVPPASRAARIRCELTAENGAAVASLEVPAPQIPGAPVNLLVAATALRPGRYTLLLRAADGPAAGRDLNRFHFLIRFQ